LRKEAKKAVKNPESVQKGPGPAESGIGVYAESSLHASLKLLVAETGDRFEVRVAGKVADILKTTGDIVEIQTQAFAKLKSKLTAFCPGHRVSVVYPIASERIIITLDPETGDVLSKRRSPKRGKIEDVFEELVYYPDMLSVPGLSLEILLVRLEEVRIKDGKGSWRRKGISIHDKRLVDVSERRILKKTADILALLPGKLPAEYTSADIAELLGRNIRFGGAVAYVLARSGLSEIAGKRGRLILYRLRKGAGKSRPLASKRKKAIY
jgi:hypothetical protein